MRQNPVDTTGLTSLSSRRQRGGLPISQGRCYQNILPTFTPGLAEVNSRPHHTPQQPRKELVPLSLLSCPEGQLLLVMPIRELLPAFRFLFPSLGSLLSRTPPRGECKRTR